MFKFSNLVFLTLVYTASYEAADLKLSLYYEVLCPDSINFVTEQLYRTYKLLGDDLEIDLVPFGFATVQQFDNGTYEFTCQHGPNECHGNKYHSCVIDLDTVAETVEFAYCTMNSDSPASDQIMEKCTKDAGITWGSLQKCYETGQADELLVKNGQRTAAIQPPLTWVPTVIFNDVFNQTLQDEASDDLLKVVCDLLGGKPDGCSSF